MNQFQQNLDVILKKGSKAGVKVMVSELVSNLRDQKPFISLSEKNRLMSQDVYRQAKALEQDKKSQNLKISLDIETFFMYINVSYK